MNHAFNLQRFLHAYAPLYADVRAELVNGDKLAHWMGFIFPLIVRWHWPLRRKKQRPYAGFKKITCAHPPNRPRWR